MWNATALCSPVVPDPSFTFSRCPATNLQPAKGRLSGSFSRRLFLRCGRYSVGHVLRLAGVKKTLTIVADAVLLLLAKPSDRMLSVENLASTFSDFDRASTWNLALTSPEGLKVECGVAKSCSFPEPCRSIWVNPTGLDCSNWARSYLEYLPNLSRVTKTEAQLHFRGFSTDLPESVF